MINNKREFVPLNGTVLLRKSEVGKQIKSGDFILKEVTSDKTIPEGIVVKADFDEIKEDDVVVFKPLGTYEFILNGESLLITNRDNILGKINKEQKI